MRKHPELQSGKFSATFTFKHTQKLWEEITTELHQIPGAVKDWKQWRKTWQDMRSSTKAKSASIKNHAKQTGGGPVSSQDGAGIKCAICKQFFVLHYNISISLSLSFLWLDINDGECIIGILLQNWSDDLHIYDVSNSEEGESYPTNNNQEITHSVPLSPQNDQCQLETPITATVNNTSHIPVTPTSNSVSIKKGVKRTAAQRYDKSIEQTEKLAEISQEDSKMRKSYYAEKLKLYKMELALKERDVIAKENICTLLEQLTKKDI
ncbi:PREDICTED: uncharacterized protein LOC105556303 [Vollenhovia emeryi]|uniref:uncharacterized protein LOC105556303 n=1 Tax=Vollenhovia emeryi TaxID=411798 RepID=UPI0005F58DB1|nr:PREDICTED: uncharacterized protein LOC105556303 [Vollenhovia emeryi]